MATINQLLGISKVTAGGVEIIRIKDWSWEPDVAEIDITGVDSTASDPSGGSNMIAVKTIMPGIHEWKGKLTIMEDKSANGTSALTGSDIFEGQILEFVFTIYQADGTTAEVTYTVSGMVKSNQITKVSLGAEVTYECQVTMSGGGYTATAAA